MNSNHTRKRLVKFLIPQCIINFVLYDTFLKNVLSDVYLAVEKHHCKLASNFVVYNSSWDTAAIGSVDFGNL